MAKATRDRGSEGTASTGGGRETLVVPRPSPFIHPIPVRYLEVDQQRVVFNMWYLAYVDDAMTAFLLEGGLPYSQMTDRGCDVQLVHAELDWKGSLRWDSPATVAVGLAGIGRTSFTLQFDFRSQGRVVAKAHCVYVAVHTDGSGKRDVPPYLIGALGVVSPLRDRAVGPESSPTAGSDPAPTP